MSDVPESVQTLLMRFVVPIIVGLVGGAFSGYMGASTAIAVLDSRVNRLEVQTNEIAQDQKVDSQTTIRVNRLEVQTNEIAAQQKANNQTIIRIETKLDMLLVRTEMGK